MEIRCIVIELKPDSRDKVDQWASFIKENKDKALDTLKNEGVVMENFFFVEIESKDYLVAYMQAESMQKAHQVVQDSLSEIDVYHKQFQQNNWVKGIEAEPVLILDRLSAIAKNNTE